MAVDAKLSVNGEGAGEHLKRIENKLVSRLKKITIQHSVEDTDFDEAN